MNAWWGAVIAVLGAVAGGAAANLLSDEVRERLDLLPRALLHIASRRLPKVVRGDVSEEWLAELDAILKRAEALPITRLLTGTRYALGLLRAAPAVARELTDVPQRSLPRITRTRAGVAAACGMFVASLWHVDGGWPAILVLFPLFVLPLFIAQRVLASSRLQEAVCGATVATLCQAMENKDRYTLGHGRRVATGSVMIAQRLGLRPERLAAIRYSGMLHDIGKLGVPTAILQKSEALTEEEYAAIKWHPMCGIELVRNAGFLDEVLAGIMHHHERIDGTGYPLGLAGQEIPEFARIIAVADLFDAVTTVRSYRAARSVEDAIAELRKAAGTCLDPEMVVAFIEALQHEGWESPPRADGENPPC